jgi:PAS domain S-box-containing protein
MNRFFSMSIRKQFYLMALILALPAVVLLIHSGLDKRSEDIEEAQEDIQQLTESIASEQQNLVAGAQQLMSVIAQLPEVRDHDTAKTQRILSDTLAVNPQYSNIIIADRAGTIWASAVPAKSAVSIPDRRFFKSALATGQFSSGEYTISRILGAPMINFGYPYKNQKGEVAGVIGVNLGLAYLREILEDMKIPSGASYLTTDRNGVILTRGISPSKTVGQRLASADFKQMQEGPVAGGRKITGVDGIEQFSYYRKLFLKGERTPCLYIRSAMPVKDVMAQANKALFVNLAFFAPFMLLAFILVWIICKHSILDRISLLLTASQRLAGGDLHARVHHLVKGGELGELGCAFDAMAGALEKDSGARKLAEDALRESERFLQAISDTEPDCVSLHARDGSLLMMNRAGVAMIEADSFSQIKSQSVLPQVAAEFREAFKSFTREVFQGKEGSLEYEFLGLKGGRLWFETHAVPFCNQQGEITSLLAVTRDVTRRKQAETSIVMLNHDLAERARQLEAVNKELETFSYTVSHDLRSPLTRISLCCQVLNEMHLDDRDFQRYIGDIYLSTQRMGELISSLLNFSQLSHREIIWDSVNLSETAKTIAAELQLSQPERRVNFKIEEGLSVHGDEVLLRNVLANLFDNAWRYTVGKETADIELGSREIESKRVFFVRDNGIGFDMDQADKLFVAFQRLHEKKGFNGHGIGLATVQRIIERHGGRVWAEGKVNGGATFYFTIENRFGPEAENADSRVLPSP